MKKGDMKIAREIILAQVASDGGKGIEEIKNIFSDSLPVYKEGYLNKERHILRAISLISKSENSDFRFFVKYDKEEWPIVYFEYKERMHKCQISFHCPGSIAVEKWATKGKSKRSYRTRWDHLSSREACKLLWCLIKDSI